MSETLPYCLNSNSCLKPILRLISSMLRKFFWNCRSVEKIMSLFNCGVAFINVLIVVVNEVLVLFQFVVFTSQELVQFSQPAAIQNFSIRLRSMDCMVVMTQIIVVVIHVRACVNVEV